MRWVWRVCFFRYRFSKMKQVAALVLVAILGRVVEGTTWTKCEFKTKLPSVLNEALKKAVCSVIRADTYDTSANNTVDGEMRYGIFQIGKYFCEGGQYACNVTDCNDFFDDTLDVDIKCLNSIGQHFVDTYPDTPDIVKATVERLFNPSCATLFDDCT